MKKPTLPQIAITGAFLIIAAQVSGQSQISSVVASLQPGTASTQSVNGATGGSLGTGAYTVNYGVSGDLVMSGFNIGTTNYSLNNTLQTTVQLRRNSLAPTIPDHQQVAWYRATTNSQSGTTRNLEATYVPTLEALLGGNTINRGTDNMFENTGNGSGNNNNIERVDFIFDGPDVLTPQNQAHLDGAGFTVMERGGNDSIYVSAILGVSGTNVTRLSAPANASAWGNNGLWGGARDTLVLRDTATSGVFQPSANVAGQDLRGLYFSLADLGVEVGETVYGYALMSGDTNVGSITGSNYDALLDVTNTTIFPQNTQAGPGGLDLVSGGSAFIDELLDTTGLITPVPEPALFGFFAALAAYALVGLRRRR